MEGTANSAGPPHLQEAKSWRLVLSLVQVEGCSFLSSANQSPSGYNYLQLYFTIVHLLRGFLSRGIFQKHKELFLGFGLWESSLVLYTHCLLRFIQISHLFTHCILRFVQPQISHLKVQINRGKQIVSSQPMAIEQPKDPITLYQATVITIEETSSSRLLTLGCWSRRVFQSGGGGQAVQVLGSSLA